MSSLASDDSVSLSLAADWFKCRHCSDSFKREDHLRRHELSHGFPRFVCDHDGCGMRFHRKDVLQRHKLVHQPNPLKRRRKPRRGVLPRGPIQQADSASGSTDASVTPTQETLPPFDPSSFGQPAESFNLSSEWDYGLQEWPDYVPLPSWQDYAVPAFDPALAPLVQPYLALAHAPNLSRPLSQMLPHPLTPHDLEACATKFRLRFLPRIPFLHHVTCEEAGLDSALGLSMAMAGALYLDEYRTKATMIQLHAVRALKQPGISNHGFLRHLQAKILLADFAVWYGDEGTRRRAIQEQQALSRDLLEYVHSSLPPLTYDNWHQWRLREEIKRTAFAFFVNSVIQTTFLGHDTPILASTADLTLPCPEGVWEAATEDEWRMQVAILGLPGKAEIHFPTAAHALLSRDTVYSTDYELATIFGQLILLCIILDTFNVASKLPTNYTSVEGWKAQDMSTFRLRDSIGGALDLWTELWWASPECLWDAHMPAHPRIENIFLHQYTTARLYHNTNFAWDRPEWTYKPIETAVEMFTSISKAGFAEVATYAQRVLSLACYYVAVEEARTMTSWLAAVGDPSYGPLNRRDHEIVTRIRQAVRRHIAHPDPAARRETTLGVAPVPPLLLGGEGTTGIGCVGVGVGAGCVEPLRHGSSIAELLLRVTDLWTFGMGGDMWKANEHARHADLGSLVCMGDV